MNCSDCFTDCCIDKLVLIKIVIVKGVYVGTKSTLITSKASKSTILPVRKAMLVCIIPPNFFVDFWLSTVYTLNISAAKTPYNTDSKFVPEEKSVQGRIPIIPKLK